MDPAYIRLKSNRSCAGFMSKMNPFNKHYHKLEQLKRGFVEDVVKIFLSLFIMFSVLCGNQALFAQGTIVVKVSGINKDGEKILAALFVSEKGFPSSPEKAYKKARGIGKSGTAELLFSEVPEGTYAIALFHDSNDDGKLNTNFFGIPKEGYAVSNNIRNLLGPPGFSESSFRHSRTNTEIRIRIIY